MLKCLLYRHFVSPEIWHLSRDKVVLHNRIECFYSTFGSRENNTQSKNHVMQMGKFIYMSLCIFKNLDKNTWMSACAKVFYWGLWLKHHTHIFQTSQGRLKQGHNYIALLGHESGILDEQTELLFTLPARPGKVQ